MGDEISSAHLHFPESFRPKPKPDAQNSARTAPMKILVFGLMRTGTFSMREALLKLGIHDVYHMRNIIDKPTDVRLWLQAFGAKYHMKGDFGMAEWEKLLGGCQAVTDVPAACFAEELIALYPDAKVILLERPVDTWYESCIHTVMKPREKSLIMQALLYLDWDHLGQMITLKQTIYGNFFGEGGLEESNVKRVYREYHERIRGVVTDKGRLLDFKMHEGEGWAELCGFLGMDVPIGELESGFPKRHERSVWQAKMKLMILGSVNRAAWKVVWWGAVLGVLVGIGIRFSGP